jgi:CheY-like chemotaxis protein
MQIATVLLADDDPFTRRIAEIALKRVGFTVRSVGDGADVLQALDESLVDLVILDGLMPTLAGPETCRRLKANPRTAGIPVIMLTARTEAAEEDEAREAGAAGYIRKPFDVATLGPEVLRLCAALSQP